MTQTHTDEIESALDACDGVRSAHGYDHNHAGFAVDVYFHDDVTSAAPISDVLSDHELRIWSVNFNTRSLTLIPAAELSYPLGGDD